MAQRADKPLVWLSGEIKSPPFSTDARLEAGFLLRRLQRGEKLGPPHSRPMRSIGKRCYELRVRDEDVTWKTMRTPKRIIENCRRRLKRYDEVVKEAQ